MTAAASSRAAWRTSSHSGANGNCIEVARPAPGVIAVRDSKDPGGSGAGVPLRPLDGIHRSPEEARRQPGTVTA